MHPAIAAWPCLWSLEVENTVNTLAPLDSETPCACASWARIIYDNSLFSKKLSIAAAPKLKKWNIVMRYWCQKKKEMKSCCVMLRSGNKVRQHMIFCVPQSKMTYAALTRQLLPPLDCPRSPFHLDISPWSQRLDLTKCNQKRPVLSIQSHVRTRASLQQQMERTKLPWSQSRTLVQVEGYLWRGQTDGQKWRGQTDTYNR